MTTANLSGSALIALIAAIAIFSVLAAALLSLTSTSGRQAAMSHLAGKADLLAESGYRYAASRYQHPQPGENGSIGVLENLDGNYALRDNDGSFDLKIFSYFFILDQPAVKTSTILTVRTPGNFPDDEIDYTLFSDEKIRIDNDFYEVTSFSHSENNIFLIGIDPALPEDKAALSMIYPVAKTIDSGEPWDSINKTISFNSNQAKMFPSRNGWIRVAGRTLTYRLKQGTLFTDVRDPNDAAMAGFSILADTSITLLPYIRIASTGIYGTDDAQIRRKINYYGTLPASFNEVFEETFDDGESSILTIPEGFEITQINESTNQVLKVGPGAGDTNLAVLDVLNASNATAQQAREAFNDFRRSSGGYLSYDAQTKIGFYSNDSFDPDFIEHKDLAAGLSFRINENGTAGGYNMYGISFLHQESPDPGMDPNIIPSALSSENEPGIVLWQQIIDADGTPHRNWLAYKKLKETIFVDEFTDGIDTNIWFESDQNWVWSDRAMFVSTNTSGFIAPIQFSITIPDNEINGHYQATLTFNSTVFESFPSVKIYDDHHNLLESRQISLGSSIFSMDLSGYIGNTITIEFYYRNMIGFGSWKVDNVQIIGQSPTHNSTLVVRLKEAAAIPFFYTGADTIEKGDRVVGADSGIMGRVITPPYMAGNTAENRPKGILLLNSLVNESEANWFGDGESLNVLGKGTIAEIDTSDQPAYKKVNIIKAFYTNENGLSAPNGITANPLDVFTKAYGRREAGQYLEWPVQEGDDLDAEQDFFQLIQWDGVNDQNVSDLIPLKDAYTINGVETLIDDTILLSHHNNLQSPFWNTTSVAPELGLHAFGSDAANHVYFDDFGFQLYYQPHHLFPSPFQQ